MSGEVKLEALVPGVGGQAAPGGDINQRPASHSDDDSGCALEEYTWVPPGLKPDQVSDQIRDLNHRGNETWKTLGSVKIFGDLGLDHIVGSW